MTTKRRRLIVATVVLLLLTAAAAWQLRMFSASVVDAQRIQLGMTRDEAANILGMKFKPIDNPRPPAMTLWCDHLYLRDGTVTIVYDERDRVSGVTVRPMTLRARIMEPFRIKP